MYYKNKRVLLASKHEKEKALAGIFSKELACEVCVENFDTDQFGTFTGEIERLRTPYETCVLKAKHAGEQFNYNLTLASEGSFGSHPALPFVQSAHEIMVFSDQENDWIIAEQLVTENTNYNMITIDKHTDIKAFLKRVDFPRHALTLQTSTDKLVIEKGIRALADLYACLDKGFQIEKQLLLATDMRAMMNPTRMQVLSELAEKLVLRVKSICPDCKAPGFGFKTTQGQLPCNACRSLTSVYETEVWGCIQCDYHELKSRRDGLIGVDPGYCNYCNP